MGMSIDEIIKYLPAPMCDSTVIDSEKQKEYEAHDMAVIIMRKYQKIESIIKMYKEDRKRFRLGDDGSKDEYLKQISEVLNGNIN